MRRACNHHQIPRLKREFLFSIDFFDEHLDQVLRSLLWTVLEGCIGVRGADDMFHSQAQLRGQQRRRVWMAQQEGNRVRCSSLR